MSSIPDLIAHKRDGMEHSNEEIERIVDAIVSGEAQKAQIGAWMMAAYIRGLTGREITTLTRAMMNSGDLLPDWPADWTVVDKHSTGGVGDKVSLILAPALAACGVKVPMISGRGLAHTGGTLDKLEAIPGFCVSMETAQIREVLKSVGCCIVGQTGSLVPADKIMYAIRDVTATVDSLGLITGSIISKKAAEKPNTLVLDVKTGNGAFMAEETRARQLAQMMVDAGCGLGIHTGAIISTMNCPLGRAVGHALEVAESVRCLQGNGPSDLMDLVNETGGLILYLSQKARSPKDGFDMMVKVINDGSALEKFKNMAMAQGASSDVATRLCDVNNDPLEVMNSNAKKTPLLCPSDGYVSAIHAMTCARAVHALGGGRNKAGEAIDLAVGLQFSVTVGDQVKNGNTWVTVYHSTPEIPPRIRKQLEDALQISDNKPEVQSRIVDKILKPTPSS